MQTWPSSAWENKAHREPVLLDGKINSPMQIMADLIVSRPLQHQNQWCASQTTQTILPLPANTAGWGVCVCVWETAAFWGEGWNDKNKQPIMLELAQQLSSREATWQFTAIWKLRTTEYQERVPLSKEKQSLAGGYTFKVSAFFPPITEKMVNERMLFSVKG